MGATGLQLKPDHEIQITVVTPFHISTAILDKCTKSKNDTQVWLTKNGISSLVASVSKTLPHMNMDLTFTKGEVFTLLSQAHVHLSGYYILPVITNIEDIHNAESQLIEYELVESDGMHLVDEASNRSLIEILSGEEENMSNVAKAKPKKNTEGSSSFAQKEKKNYKSY